MTHPVGVVVSVAQGPQGTVQDCAVRGARVRMGHFVLLNLHTQIHPLFPVHTTSCLHPDPITETDMWRQGLLGLS